MLKKLVYSFYISKETYSKKINEIHFRCLEYFKDSFDCADITLIREDNEGNVDEEIYLSEQNFLQIFKNKDISFSIIKNNEYRESIVFYEKIVKRLNNNELVFFSHNKGITNVPRYNEKQIYSWICGMYYYCLNYPEELNTKLINGRYYCFGSFLTKFEKSLNKNKYGWYYIGTFFWINCPKLINYIRRKGIEMPKLDDRFYDENFLGDIIDTYPQCMASSHNDYYLENCYNFYEHCTDYMNFIYDTQEDGFNNFYKKITA